MIGLLENEFDLSVVSMTPKDEESKDLAKLRLANNYEIQYKSFFALLAERQFFRDVDVFLVWSTPFLQIFASVLGCYTRKPTLSFVYSYPDVISDFRFRAAREKISFLLKANTSANGVSLRELVTSPPLSMPIIFVTSRLPFLKGILVQSLQRKHGFVDLGAPDKKVQVVKMGIDTQLFCPEQECGAGTTSIRYEKLKIAYFGPLTTFRGVDTLLRAFRKVKDNHNEVELYLIGRSAKPSSIINSLINELDLQNEVTVINQFLSETELINLMQKFDIVVSLLKSSVHAVEPPFIVLEAMSLGKPVISTQLNGISEIISHKKTGLLVRPNDVDGAVRAIEYVLENKKRGLIMGKKAREFIVDKHDAKTFLGNLTESIKKAAA